MGFNDYKKAEQNILQIFLSNYPQKKKNKMIPNYSRMKILKKR